MTREKARAKWEALRRMTVERGCTPPEADTAARLAARLQEMYGFIPPPPRRDDLNEALRRRAREAWEAQQRREARRPTPKARHDWTAEYEAARNNFKWEERHCGKKNCWCASSRDAHGPYKYSKLRKGRRVYSIYVGGAARPHRGSKHA